MIVAKPSLALLLVVAACAGCGDGASGTGAPPREAEPADTRPGLGCGGGKPKPVTVRQLIDVFARHGIALDREECLEPSQLYYASNLAPVVDSAEETEAVSEREGDIFCGLYGTSEGTEIDRTHFPDEEETHLDVLNVSCTVYPSYADRAEQQIANVEEAMRELVSEAK